MKAAKEKPKRKGPLDAIPETTSDWATYDIPDEALEAFLAMASRGVNSQTINKPVSINYSLCN